MPKVKLLPQTLAKLKPGPPAVDRGRVSYYDTESRGLLLRVGPKERTFYFEYSFRGRSRRMPLGAVGDKSLKAYRDEATAKRNLVAAGIDPIDAKEAEAQRSEAETFAELGARALETLGKRLREKTLSEYKRLFKVNVVPAMGAVDPRDPVAVKRSALKMGDKLIARGNGYGANRSIALASTIMSFAISTDRDDRYITNPLLRLPKLFKESVRTRLYSTDEVRNIVACARGTAYEHLIPLLLATGTRATETMAAEWREIDGNTWTIPAHKAKIREPRPVHLNAVALAVLEELRARSDGSPFLFPSGSGGGHLVRQQKVIYEVRRTAPDEETPWVCGVADFELHDLRRFVRSGLSELGISGEVAELMLGHLPSKLTRTYAPYPAYWRLGEQRKASERWGALLSRILAPEAPEAGRVVAFPGR